MWLIVQWLLHFVVSGLFFKAIIVTSVKSLGHSPISYLLLIAVPFKKNYQKYMLRSYRFSTYLNRIFCFFFWQDSPLSGPGPPHSQSFQITLDDAPQSVGLLWTSDHLVAETSTWHHTTLTTHIHPCPQWDSNPQSQQASGRRPTP